MKNFLHTYLYIFGDRKGVPFLIAFFLFVSLFDLLGIGLIGPFVAAMNNPDVLLDHPLILEVGKYIELPHSAADLFMILGAVISGVFVVKSYLSFRMQRHAVYYGYAKQAVLKGRLMDSYVNAPYEFHLKKNSASLVNAIQQHTLIYTEQALIPSLRFIADSILITAITIFLFWTDYQAMMVLGCLFFILYFVYDKVLKKRILQTGKLGAQASEDTIRNVNHGIQGVKEIHVLGNQQYFLSQVEKNSYDMASARSEFNALTLMPRYLVEVFMVLFIIGLSLLALNTKGTMVDILPTLGVFSLAGIRLIPTLNQMIMAVNQMRYASYPMKELYADIQEANALIQARGDDEQVNVADLKSFESLSLVDVNYRYPDAVGLALNNINFSIAKGESIGIVGVSGAGKSTLMDVLLGVLTPESGDVLVNGHVVNTGAAALQGDIAYIPQDVFIIDDTLRKNIALGVETKDIDENRVVESLTLAKLLDVVNDLTEGLDTVIGENGVLFSGGQKQRIALARAFYFGRELIVMDEATSALDDETEKAIVNAVKDIGDKRTLITIAHRLSTVKHCDRLYKINDGAIVKVGSYDEVVG